MMMAAAAAARSRGDDNDDNLRLRQQERARGFRVRAGDQWSPQEIADKHIERLPTSAASYYEQDDGHRFERFSWLTARTILSGTRSPPPPPRGGNDGDDGGGGGGQRYCRCCALRLLREFESTIVRDILQGYLCIPPAASHVRLTIPAPFLGRDFDDDVMRFTHGRKRRKVIEHENNAYDLLPAASTMPDDAGSSGSTHHQSSSLVSYAVCGEVNFPPPADRNVNMMPFILGSKDSLPLDLQCYHGLIEACPYEADEMGKVCYLTVHECFVEAGKTQRRPGLHIDSPVITAMDSANEGASGFTAAVEHPWGIGICYDKDSYHGGIFVASSVTGTTRVWDALVDQRAPGGIVDHHGCCERLRRWLGGPGTLLRANEIVWMTDCTPHEAVPMEAAGYRQFFRLVSPYVSTWYADHSTANPNVPLPGRVRVVRGSKFAQPVDDAAAAQCRADADGKVGAREHPPTK